MTKDQLTTAKAAQAEKYDYALRIRAILDEAMENGLEQDEILELVTEE